MPEHRADHTTLALKASSMDHAASWPWGPAGSEAGQDHLAAAAAALDERVGLLEVLGADRAHGLGQRGPQRPLVDEAADLGKELVLGLHVGGAEEGAGEHQLPMERE